MKVFQQKVLRFDVDPIVYQPSILSLKEKISLTYEADVYYKDPIFKILILNWKIHYTDDKGNEVIGLLVKHKHLLESIDISVDSLRDIVSTSALNVQSKLEERISPEFFLNVNIYKMSNADNIKKIFAVLTDL
uniref:hypothetical protein n=1 Tax=Pedobacter schmidteae TaxID=2201271 RepID=UPI000EADC1FA|nr:hypothetical protein [Pedobacter schmidteae]